MNDSTPFDTIGDEPLEARIVSWVLGEASAFEAAELERLCEERPELLVFRRRMRALHGLLTEAEAAEPDDAWKLPAEKRKALEEIFGEEIRANPEQDKEIQIRRSGRRALLAIAACLMLTLFLGALFSSGGASIKKARKLIQADRLSAGEEKVEFLPGGGGASRPDTEALETSETEQLADSGSYNYEPRARRQMRDPATRTSGSGAARRIQASAAGDFDLEVGAASSLAGSKSSAASSSSRSLEISPPPTEVFALRAQEPANLKFEQSSTSKFLAGAESAGETKKALPPGDKSITFSGESNLSREIQGELHMESNLSAAPDSFSDGYGETPRHKIDGTTPASPAVDPFKVEGPEVAIGNDSLESVDDSNSLGYNETSTSPVKPASAPELNAAQDLLDPGGKSTGGIQWNLREQPNGSDLGLDKSSLAEPSAPSDDQARTSAVDREIVTLEGRAANLRKQLEDPALADSKKQMQFDEWKETQVKLQVLAKSKAKAAPAKKSPLESIEEIAASEEPFSTFSLNINDASFQIAKAALEKGERPDPDAIKVEQFYNAVDYGDSAPGADEPVAARVEQSAHPIIPGRNLVRVSLKTAAAGRGASQPLRLTLLVDQSGSMVREDRRTAMSSALKQLGGLLTPNDHFTVVGFSRESHLLADNLTGDKAGQLSDLINQTASEGGTNLEQAINLAEQMAARPHPAGEQNRIVLFTDGAANLGNANPERLAERVKALRQQGIALDIAGIGADGVNDRLLSELARNGNGRYYVVGDSTNESFARQLAGAFRPAAENVKVQVRFNPDRVGRYKLIGFEKDRLKTEDFRNDAVDAAELAAEEAGVAIYQVETLPQGSGEIGEVSVRFRDTSKGEMVERKWTMPFESTTQAFDRATPSMQLAGLSMLAAEKLKGGPLADAIDFKQLSGSQSLVKQFYGSSPRVADMLHVIDLLK